MNRYNSVLMILVTGASGYVGSAVARLLTTERGEKIAGLARSDEAARKLEAMGVEPVSGSLEDPASLAAAARGATGVIHCAIAWGAQAGTHDRAAVEAMLGALGGSGKPFVYSSGVWVMGGTAGRVAGEAFPLRPPPLVAWRPAVEKLVLDAGERNVRGIVIRAATVYGHGGGRIAMLLQGRQPVIGDGENHWSFVHVDDLAELYVLAYERAPAGSLYVAAAGPAVAVKDVAAACGVTRRITLDEARRELGPLADALVLDQRIGSTRAGRELGWIPSRPGVLEAIRREY